MEPALQAAVEEVRAAMRAPALRPKQKQRRGADPKWKIGDTLLTVPAEDRAAVAAEAGLSKGEARNYANVAEAWPPNTRREASWAVHRELAKKSSPLYDRADRFSLIRDGMTRREAAMLTGTEVERKPIGITDDEEVISDIVRIMLSPRRRIMPRIYEKLNESAAGRQAGRARRSTNALRRLDQEIRLAQAEIRRQRELGSPGTRALELHRQLMNLEARIEECALLWEADRWQVDEELWTRLGKRLDQLGTRARQVAARILSTTDVEDVEGWDDADAWQAPELLAGDDAITDAEIVDQG
jgi:hypothetical protein